MGAAHSRRLSSAIAYSQGRGLNAAQHPAGASDARRSAGTYQIIIIDDEITVTAPRETSVRRTSGKLLTRSR